MFFSSSDLTAGYFQMFQMASKKESWNLTALNNPMGIYNFKRLPMGLASALGAFQTQIEYVFCGLSYEVALVYLDEIIVFGKTFEEHLMRLVQVFAWLEKVLSR